MGMILFPLQPAKGDMWQFLEFFFFFFFPPRRGSGFPLPTRGQRSRTLLSAQQHTGLLCTTKMDQM